MARLVVVSNRVGVPDKRRARRRARGRDPAGAAAARRRLVRLERARRRRRSGAAPRRVEHDNVTYVTIDLRKDDYQEYYNGFANRVLWPILHYRLDLAEFTRRDLGGYFRVNEFFASNLREAAAGPTT